MLDNRTPAEIVCDDALCNSEIAIPKVIFEESKLLLKSTLESRNNITSKHKWLSGFCLSLMILLVQLYFQFGALDKLNFYLGFGLSALCLIVLCVVLMRTSKYCALGSMPKDYQCPIYWETSSNYMFDSLASSYQKKIEENILFNRVRAKFFNITLYTYITTGVLLFLFGLFFRS